MYYNGNGNSHYIKIPAPSKSLLDVIASLQTEVAETRERLKEVEEILKYELKTRNAIQEAVKVSNSIRTSEIEAGYKTLGMFLEGSRGWRELPGRGGSV